MNADLNIAEKFYWKDELVQICQIECSPMLTINVGRQ